jgi:DNA-binding NtrC family response regulator
LVIDDDAEALKTLGSLLSALGVEKICEVPSAEQALEILKAQSFSMILTDYRLEGMNGVEFLEQLRSQGNQTPVIMLSGAPDKAGVIRAIHQPAVDFFGKPFRIDDLVGAMEKFAQAA